MFQEHIEQNIFLSDIVNEITSYVAILSKNIKMSKAAKGKEEHILLRHKIQRLIISEVFYCIGNILSKTHLRMTAHYIFG